MCIDIHLAIRTYAEKGANRLMNIPEYRDLRKLAVALKAKNKELYSGKCQRMREIEEANDYGEFLFHEKVKEFRSFFGNEIGISICQKLATRAFNVTERILNFQAFELSEMHHGMPFSIDEKMDKGIRYRIDRKTGKERVFWNGLEITLVPPTVDEYTMAIDKDSLKFAGIGREMIMGRMEYYIRLSYKGASPNAEIYHGPVGTVGLDVGPSVIAVCSASFAGLIPLFPNCSRYDKEIYEIQRYLNRSSRTNNPQNYNEDGTTKPAEEREPWKDSKSYMEAKSRLKELYRLKKEEREQYQDGVINFILSLGNRFVTEEVNWNDLARRSKNIRVNKKTGRPYSKSRFGKSIGKHAPAWFMSRLELKLKMADGQLIYSSTYNLRASQYNHVINVYDKAMGNMKIRIKDIGGHKVQRDLYSAFLLMCINDSLDGIDREKCIRNFASFIEKNNAEIKRIRALGKDNVLAWYVSE